jgi:hypothetical protein
MKLSFLARLSVPRRVGLVLAAAHLALVCFVAAMVLWINGRDDSLMMWLMLFMVDLPISVICPLVLFGLGHLLPAPQGLEFFVHGVLIYFIFFGLYGSLLYYLVGNGLCLLSQKLFLRGPRGSLAPATTLTSHPELVGSTPESPKTRKLVQAATFYTFASLGAVMCLRLPALKPVRDMAYSGQRLLLTWTLTYIVCWLFWVSCMFRHWKRSTFTSGTVRAIWFWVLLLGAPILLLGPLAYYVCVYTNNRGLANRAKQPGG